jgi:hypothetical protein
VPPDEPGNEVRTPARVTCSFCGRTHNGLDAVSGPGGVCICRECVRLFVQLVDEGDN